ncbi:hypothetical protein [Bacillus mycoides]|nr:hypothetical protein [Bacillus mycoides]
MIVLKLNVTPHIIFAGDKENVLEHLHVIFRQDCFFFLKGNCR